MQAHAGSRNSHGTMVFATDAIIPVMCWCETHVVGVPQAEVRWHALTRSCGNPDCVNPDNGERMPGYRLNRRNLTSLELVDGTPVLRTLRKSTPYFDRKLEERRRVGRRPVDVVRRDRDVVLELWSRGFRTRGIAGMTGMSVATIEKDIQWLKEEGRL